MLTWNRHIAFGPTGGGGGGTPASGLKYPDDGARRMPVANSLQAIEAGRRQRSEGIRRSGRASTRLAGAPGTQPYVSTSIGGTQ